VAPCAALRQLPTIIADNGGYDSSELVTQLRAAHSRGEKTMGLGTCCAALCCVCHSLSLSLISLENVWSAAVPDMVNGQVADMLQLGIRESFKSKLQVLVSAAEAAEMILRVDDIIKCAPRAREQ
jgi:T-complex protein 1 subunit beta